MDFLYLSLVSANPTAGHPLLQYLQNPTHTFTSKISKDGFINEKLWLLLDGAVR
jgi:hypothetical protein